MEEPAWKTRVAELESIIRPVLTLRECKKNADWMWCLTWTITIYSLPSWCLSLLIQILIDIGCSFASVCNTIAIERTSSLASSTSERSGRLCWAILSVSSIVSKQKRMQTWNLKGYIWTNGLYYYPFRFPLWWFIYEDRSTSLNWGCGSTSN